MKLNDLIGGVEKFLQEAKEKSQKIIAGSVILTQLNPIIIPTILPATQSIDPINLIVPKLSAQEMQAESIEVPKIVLSLTNIVEIADDNFKVKKVESRAEIKAKKAKILAEKKRQERLVQQAKINRQKMRSATFAGPGNCESYRGLVSKYFPASQVNNALLTMKRESGCRTNAVSRTNDHGLMQINYRWHAGKVGHVKNRLYDPETNIRIAAGIYNGRGWSAWYAVRGILW